MKNEMTAAEKRKTLADLLATANFDEVHFRISMVLSEDFRFFAENGFKFETSAQRGDRLSGFCGDVFIAAILTKLGARSMACDYLLETSFNDFYKSLKNTDDREKFSFMVYSALDIFA